MAETQNNIPILHRAEWQTMMQSPTATAVGAFVINDNHNLSRFALLISSNTVHYLYDHTNDDWMPIASGAFPVAIAAGSCGTYSDWSNNYTATGGSTTTIAYNVATFNINGFVVGEMVEFLSGTAANLGLRRTITAINTPATATGTGVLTLDSALPSAVANNDTFKISSGRYFVLTAGTLAANYFKSYDIATGVWTGLSNTGLPATWGTDGRLVSTTMIGNDYETVAIPDIFTATTIGLSTKAWTASQWVNYQVRITSGKGVGQIRSITANTATTLTVAAWTTTPDATSAFVIEGNIDVIYALGNNAVTLYKYSISGNSWSTVAPTAARGGAAVAGMSADFVGITGDTIWADVTNIRDGKYIYSLRGTGAVLDRFNISGGTNGVGTWDVVIYHPYLTTFALGDSTDWEGTFIYIAKEGSATVPQRFYRYNIVKNSIVTCNTDWYLNGAALIGNKIWIQNLSTAKVVKWLYCLGSTSTNLRRVILF